MTQTVFNSETDAFCGKYLIKVPGLPDPSSIELGRAAITQQTRLFENLMLFDKISLEVTGESLPVVALIGLLGPKGFDSLIEQGALEFVLWDQNIGYVVQNIPGLHGMVRMKYSSPVYTDPEQSLNEGLNRMNPIPTERKCRQYIRRLVP